MCDIPRFSIRSPALAHTTIAKTMTSVLIRSLLSLAIFMGVQSFPEAVDVPGTETMGLSKSPPLRAHFKRSARNFRKPGAPTQAINRIASASSRVSAFPQTAIF